MPAPPSRRGRSPEGLEADVVTFNQVTDVDFLVKTGFISADWQQDFANNASSPFYSLPAFLVRTGNPKNIKDWDDLVRDDVQVIFPNPKTSGNARYTYLAAAAFRQGGVQQRPGQGGRRSSTSCSTTCRCSTPAAALPRPPSSSARSATC